MHSITYAKTVRRTTGCLFAKDNWIEEPALTRVNEPSQSLAKVWQEQQRLVLRRQLLLKSQRNRIERELLHLPYLKNKSLGLKVQVLWSFYIVDL